MGHVEEDPRGSDEGSWLVRLVSSLLVPVRDIVTGGPSAVLVVAHPPTGLFVPAAGRPHHFLWYICNTMMITLLEDAKESWLKAWWLRRSRQSCDFLEIGDALIGFS